MDVGTAFLLSLVSYVSVSCLCVFGHDACNGDPVAPRGIVNNDNVCISVKERHPGRIRSSRSERKDRSRCP